MPFDVPKTKGIQGTFRFRAMDDRKTMPIEHEQTGNFPLPLQTTTAVNT